MIFVYMCMIKPCIVKQCFVIIYVNTNLFSYLISIS